MNLADARSAVVLALGRMNALYQKPLFDEWVRLPAILSGPNSTRRRLSRRPKSRPANLRRSLLRRSAKDWLLAVER